MACAIEEPWGFKVNETPGVVLSAGNIIMNITWFWTPWSSFLSGTGKYLKITNDNNKHSFMNTWDTFIYNSRRTVI